MNIQDIFFYLFAALTVICAIMVVANPFSRNPVTSAMFLVLTIVWMAALFVLLHAFLLAAVQILVYAGAVMVLFLFVIMLLDFERGRTARNQTGRRGPGNTCRRCHRRAAGAFDCSIGKSGNTSHTTDRGRNAALGTLLFTNYVLPFEIVSLLLLVAMVARDSPEQKGPEMTLRNTNQKKLLLCGICVAVGMILVPPWTSIIDTPERFIVEISRATISFLIHPLSPRVHQQGCR